MRLFQSRLFVYLTASLAGALLVLAFAPFFIWPLAILAPVILMLLWLKAPPRRAVYIGFAFGLGFFGFGVSWVFYSIYEFGQAPFAFAALLTLIFVLIFALYPALLGWLQRPSDRAHQRTVWRVLIVIPAGWVCLEWVRGWLFTGFPWLQLGYSQLLPDGGTLFAAVAPAAGVLGISYVVMLSAGLVLCLLAGSGNTRWWSFAGIMLLAGCLYGLGQRYWTAPKGGAIAVALVQGNIAQKDKWDPRWLLPTVDRYSGLTEAHMDADLIVWPEVALPGTYQLFDEFVLKPLQRELAKHRSELLTGILYEDNNGRIYNSLMRVGDDPEFYFKRHLVPFGEVIPLRGWMPWLDKLVLVATDDLYPGKEATLLHAAGQTIGSSICYEDAFGEEMADFLPQATMLVNVSNDAWFGPTIAPEQHLQIAQMRALELGRPLLRATNTGVTAIIDGQGRVSARATVFSTTVLRGEVTGRSGYTPFARWRNLPLIVLLMILTIVGTIAIKRKERPR